MNTQTIATTPTVYALILEPEFAGTYASQLIAAFFSEAEAKAHPDAGREVYDGVMASTKGRIRVVELEPDARILTLASHGVSFGLTRDNQAGAWYPDNTPAAIGPDREAWTWTGAQSRYITALFAARNPEDWESVINR